MGQECKISSTPRMDGEFLPGITVKHRLFFLIRQHLHHESPACMYLSGLLNTACLWILGSTTGNYNILHSLDLSFKLTSSVSQTKYLWLPSQLWNGRPTQTWRLHREKKCNSGLGHQLHLNLCYMLIFCWHFQGTAKNDCQYESAFGVLCKLEWSYESIVVIVVTFVADQDACLPVS